MPKSKTAISPKYSTDIIQRCHDAPAVEHAHRREIKQIQKIAEPRQRDENWSGEEFAQRVADQCTQASEQRPTDTYTRFHPGIARRFLERNERAHKRNKHRRADLESKFFGNNQMARFMDEQKQD